MKALTLLAVAALIGVCACAYLRGRDDDTTAEMEKGNAVNAEGEDHEMREKRRVLTKRKHRRRKPAATSFILGGQEVRPHAYPMMVSIMAWGTNICAGVLIHRRWVLTAAHCLGDPWEASDLEIVAGIHDLSKTSKTQQIIGVDQQIIHSQYNSNTEDYDIGLLKLSKPVRLNRAVKLVKLPTTDVRPGKKCLALGWGHVGGKTGWEHNTFPDKLRSVKLPIVSKAMCTQASWHGANVTDNMLCAGYAAGKKDSCNGDSGGPLLCRIKRRWRVSGIISWGDGCGKPNKPGVYVRVTMFLKWITEMTDRAV